MIDRYRALYESLAQLFGFRLRYCYSGERFDTAAGALVEGLALRQSVNEHLIRQFFVPDPGEAATSLDHEEARSRLSGRRPRELGPGVHYQSVGE